MRWCQILSLTTYLAPCQERTAAHSVDSRSCLQVQHIKCMAQLLISGMLQLISWSAEIVQNAWQNGRCVTNWVMTSISCWPTWGHQSWAFSLSVSQWCTPELPRSGSPPVGSSTSLWWCRSRSHGGPHGGCGGASVAGWCAMLVATALAEGDQSMCVTTCESG